MDTHRVNAHQSHLSSTICFILVATLLLLSCVTRAALLVENTTVYTMTSAGRLEHQDVLIEGERITALGPTGQLSTGPSVRRIDGRGRFLMPGLIEMHGHLPMDAASGSAVDDLMFLFVANGVTTVRGVLGASPQLQLRERIAAGSLLAPSVVLASPGFSGSHVKQPAEALQLLEHYKSQGWDLIKVFDGLDVDTYRAIVQQAKLLELPVAGHVPKAVGLYRVLEAGQDTIEHLDGYIAALGGERRRLSESELERVARLTRVSAVSVVPTMAVWEVLLKVPTPEQLAETSGLAYMPQSVVARWKADYRPSWWAQTKSTVKKTLGRAENHIIAANRRELLRVMAREGVDILFGTDAPQVFSVPGFSVHREMEVMEQSGLTTATILHSATAAAGRALSRWGHMGVVEAGARADLLLLQNDPMIGLAALRDPLAVVLRGEWLGRQAIRLRLAAIAERAARN